jgi:signal peptidase I
VTIFLSCLAALLAAMFLVLRRAYVVVTVTGDSMRPTLDPGDRVLVRRTPLRRVRRGQLVVVANPATGQPDNPGLRMPDDPGPRMPDDPPWLVKRAAAVPGDAVPEEVPGLRAIGDGRVPDGRLVILGDNTDRSFDSRRAGYFAADTLLGVVVRRLGRPLT